MKIIVVGPYWEFEGLFSFQVLSKNSNKLSVPLWGMFTLKVLEGHPDS